MNLIRSLLVLITPLVIITSGMVWGNGTPDRIHAINFLGTVDCAAYPESQKVLIQALQHDPEEAARYAAVKAITEQLKRGNGPDPNMGWRPIPDWDVLRAMAAIAPGGASPKDYFYDTEEDLSLKEACRGDYCQGCCNEEVTKALAWCAFECDEFGCPVEPSKRVRDAAERALSLCCPVLESMESASSEDSSLPPSMPNVQDFQFSDSGRGFESRANAGATTFGLGRADNNNRLNIFDNVSAQPVTRVWGGFQYAQASNTAIDNTTDTDLLFASYFNNPGDFKSATGFDTPEQFSEYNQGVGTDYIKRPDAVLYRLGFEYAFTYDFSIAMQAQYMDPLQDFGQPALFTNPSIALKHVIYRGCKTTFSGLLNITPQIPAPRFGITEDTTRLAPGALMYRQLNEDSFLMGGAQTNIPMEHNQILTADWYLGYGYWLYKHPLVDFPDEEECKPFLMGIVPQFEVLGKHVLNNNTIVGMFGTNPNPPMTNPDGNDDGVVTPGESPWPNGFDASRDIYIPGTFPPQRFSQSGFIFEEPRHVIDLTAGATVLFRNNVSWANGVSVPVTGGAARRIEFLTALNILF